jgi:hypothetical protein
MWIWYGNNALVQAVRYNAATGTWGAVSDLSVPSAEADDPRIAFDDAGNGVAIWERSDGTNEIVQSTRWNAQSSGVLRAPVNLAATVVGNTVTATWTMPAGSIAPDGFVLEGGVSPGSVLASVPTGSAATTFTFVAPTGVFYIRIHAVAGATRSGPSNEIRITVNLPSPPSPPENLVGSAVGSELTLAWRNSSSGGAPTSMLLEVTGAIAISLPLPLGERFSFAGVPPGTYTLAVRAVNASGASAPSNSVTLTFPGPCVVPGTPTNFTATKAGSTITVSWAPPVSGPTPTGYVLGVRGTFVGSIPTPDLALSGTVPPGTYILSVAATNACGASAPTPTQTITIP